MQNGDLPNEIDFSFEYDKDYRILASNGVWGGVTTRGEMKLDFFVESLGIPDSIKNKVEKDGKLGDEITRSPEKRYIRRLQVGVLLSQVQALSLAEFIQQHIKDVKDVQEKTEKREKG